MSCKECIMGINCDNVEVPDVSEEYILGDVDAISVVHWIKRIFFMYLNKLNS